MNNPVQVTAYIIARPGNRHLRGAIESVLAQQDTAQIEVLVIHRGSTDGAAEILESFQDSRVRQISVPANASITHCHNLAVERSSFSLIAHVEPTGIVLPGAFRKVGDRMNAVPNAGLVHGYSFEIADAGTTTREAFRERRTFLLQTRRPGMDYHWALLFSENEIDAFRVYSRKALDVVGPFNEGLNIWAEYDLALRIADRFPIELVPEMIYAFRSGDNHGPISRVASVKNCLHRFSCCRALQESKKVSFLAPGECDLIRPLIQGFWRSIGLDRMRERFVQTVRRLKDLRGSFFWKWVVPTTDRVYLRFAGRLPWWPINLFQIRSEVPPDSAARLAYYTWRFPTLSQTFVHRELAALKRSGIPLLVVADEPGDMEMVDENARSLLGQTEYLDQVDKDRLREYKRYFFSRNPFLYTNLLFYLMTRQYRDKKNILEDLHVFSRAVALAGLLKDKEAGHIHAPWADQTALIALLASKLLGITYSVQARAHDVHRNSYLYGLQDKLVNAEFVVTNTVYNESYLRELLGKEKAAKVKLIHNGLDLHRFAPQRDPGVADSRGYRILCVARLIEQKGLIHLLRAMKIMLDRGLDVSCEIIGAPEEPDYTNYYLQLKLLHKNLGLGDRVAFKGAQSFSAILDKYAAADLFVLPCVIAEDGSRDITPNALIEAMAMGLCVVSTPVTGVPEIVEDGVSGVLVPPGDAKALADVMLVLLADTETRVRMGQNARKKVAQKFDVNRNIAQYVELFSRVGGREPVAHAVSPAADRAVV